MTKSNSEDYVVVEATSEIEGMKPIKANQNRCSKMTFSSSVQCVKNIHISILMFSRKAGLQNVSFLHLNFQEKNNDIRVKYMYTPICGDFLE